MIMSLIVILIMVLILIMILILIIIMINDPHPQRRFEYWLEHPTFCLIMILVLFFLLFD